MASKVKPIPEGMHTVTPHLVIRGASQAIDFYKKAFGAVELNRAPGPNGTVMHAEIKVGDSMLFLADEFPQWGSNSPLHYKGSPVVLNLYVEDVDAMFNRAVAAGAQVKMPLQNQFWGDRYGKLTDPFGHEWGLASHVEDVSPAEMKKRMAEAMAQMSQGGKPT
jgi:PhnB protein